MSSFLFVPTSDLTRRHALCMERGCCVPPKKKKHNTPCMGCNGMSRQPSYEKKNLVSKAALDLLHIVGLLLSQLHLTRYNDKNFRMELEQEECEEKSHNTP